MKTWTVDDVMTRDVVSVGPDATYREIVGLLLGKRFSAVPVTDPIRQVVGVVSESDLVRKIEYADGGWLRVLRGRRRRADRRKAQARTAAQLMNSPAVVAVSGTSIVAAARRMHSAGVKRLPVVDDLGRLIGIVTRTDLLNGHLRPDADIRSDVSGMVAAWPGAAVAVEVVAGVVTLSGQVDRWSTMEVLTRRAHQVTGVVDVASTLQYSLDDRQVLSTGVGT